jgi:hypothetical protein
MPIASFTAVNKPPFSIAELLALFERIGLVKTVAELRRLGE